ncbi:MAG TPA: MarR family transcriptional regulator [Acidimicrobiia bacterium]|nr:MarR family transcriptional regulator [Acidimicrobiia bacterium]
MTDTAWLDERESRAWRGFQAMADQLETALHRSLVRNTGLSLSDYAVLVYLSESPEDRLRAFELGAALRWEKSRLSHHLRRMETRGLVERRTCANDGRGLWVALTPEGRKAIEEAAPLHVADVRSLLIDQLTKEQQEALAVIAEKVLAAMPSDEDLCAT